MTLKVFKAEWCGPCKQLTPTLEELKNEGHDIVYLDVDKEKDEVTKYGIRGVPTMVKVDGDETKVLVGNQSKEKILEFLGV